MEIGVEVSQKTRDRDTVSTEPSLGMHPNEVIASQRDPCTFLLLLPYSSNAREWNQLDVYQQVN